MPERGAKAPEWTWTRRRLLQVAAASGAAAALPGALRASSAPPRVVVVGAGAFGGWTALWLRRRGADVTLLDAWGPGNARASSGGETRVIRGMYGADRLYSEWVRRSFTIWEESARAWGAELYRPTGALWLFRGDDAYARSAAPVLAELGMPATRLDLAEAARRFPQIDLRGVQHVWLEERAGYLTARAACQRVVAALVAEGGTYRRALVRPGELAGGRMGGVRLPDGSTLAADVFVFACGPWLGEMFPDVVGAGIRPTRQEVFYFGTPPGDPRFEEGTLPVWIDFGERVFYGIPGNLERGFKVADDTHGETVDPSSLERLPSAEALARARALLAERFPGMAKAPLLESRVCQYENSPDGHYLIDRHPEAGNVWLVGGGSGHGYKLGPALGEAVAGWVLGGGNAPERFGVARLAASRGADASQLRSGGEGR
jgi:glycine/D-amino acid oxidase-like deaminating enzyme